jgi:hypothetical protein
MDVGKPPDTESGNDSCGGAQLPSFPRLNIEVSSAAWRVPVINHVCSNSFAQSREEKVSQYFQHFTASCVLKHFTASCVLISNSVQSGRAGYSHKRERGIEFA